MSETVAAPPQPQLREPHEVLADIDRQYAALTAALGGLSPAQKLEPDATGVWSVKDVLAHLGRWNEVALAEMQRYLGGDETRRDYSNYLELNDIWAAEDRNLTLSAAERRFETSHLRVVELLRSLPPDRWIPPVRGWAKAALWNHYPEHIEWLCAWRARRGY